MPGPLLPEIRMCPEPNRIVVLVDPTDNLDTERMSAAALEYARKEMPKVTGYMASTLSELWGNDHFGIYFPDRRVWFQEQGTRPHTMRNLAGKTIPMWVEDVDPKTAANPKTKSRVTVDGRKQYLIFRKVAQYGQTRKATRRVAGGGTKVVNVPRSYPGAPGRIARREAGRPLTTAGRTGGRVAAGNVGVRWRHPGLTGRQFLNFAMALASDQFGVEADAAYLVDEATFYPLIRS